MRSDFTPQRFAGLTVTCVPSQQHATSCLVAQRYTQNGHPRTSILQTIDLTVFDVRWRILCADRLASDLLSRNFREFVCSFGPAQPDEQIRVEAGTGTPWQLIRPRREPLPIADSYELLYCVEKTLTVDTQRHRPDLFFLHAAALALDECAVLLVASSGSGKSTTAWAMTHRGFSYLSDELAPIELATMTVQPYPHALCLKSAPPPPFELPPSIIVTEHTMHVPTDCIASVRRHPTALRGVFFNRYDATASVPSIESVGVGEASALIYSNGLNQLAHDRAGLAAAAQIASACACYRITTNDLDRSCALIVEVLQADQCDQTT